ncbi:MAG: hypothetical protein JWO25_3801 [Alphaproteobacteria bacterium]|nr:hypothetical protein [Alphaproteobacteria bacterium]MDB5722862.1 hypothetical protein [Alphaproteobacteria bacterium]
MTESKEAARAGIDSQIRSVMTVIEEQGEALIQSGVDADAVVRGTLLAAMFLGSPLADYSRLAQWLRDTALGLDEAAG